LKIDKQNTAKFFFLHRSRNKMFLQLKKLFAIRYFFFKNNDVTIHLGGNKILKLELSIKTINFSSAIYIK
jgi:hypothetical protein